MLPVLPKLIIAFEGGDRASAASITGVFGFTWAAMQLVFSPVLGSPLSWLFVGRPHLPGAPYLLAGFLTVGALLLSWRLTSPAPGDAGSPPVRQHHD